ncbi:MAG: phosphoribosyl-AMP cyclohydrolase [Lentisphaerae bacterium]|nr:phosphoribosyl-AMP cyclohydrolase [Lentisphaerota bacterium]
MDLEEGQQLQIDFEKIARMAANGAQVIPVVVQHADTGAVLLLAYTNAHAFQEALRRRQLVLWSTSRNELWVKGQTSGQTFELLEAYINCEQNSLLYRVRPRQGGICHTRNREQQPRDCFYRRIRFDSLTLENTDP